MARKHGGLGRGLDALIPMRQEVEKAMQSADSEGVEILFADEDETDEPDIPQQETRFLKRFHQDLEEQPTRSDQEKIDVSRETQIKNARETQNDISGDIQTEAAGSRFFVVIIFFSDARGAYKAKKLNIALVAASM